MMKNDIAPYKLLLASKSPRRHYLLKELGFSFRVVNIDTDESYPEELQAEEIAIYLCQKKSEDVAQETLEANEILITADTIVWLENECIGKPVDEEDAKNILRKLSGKTHQVYTGICLKSHSAQTTFYSKTDVTFRELKNEEIEHYIEKFRPMDKAGAYGVQDWIGYIGVTGINGCYYNVMGFPVSMFYEELMKFLNIEE
jgi:septum formation protein